MTEIRSVLMVESSVRLSVVKEAWSTAIRFQSLNLVLITRFRTGRGRYL